MSDRDRYVPTPEELEEGKLKRSEQSNRGEPDESEDTGGVRTFLRRRMGVGRRRKYEEAESKKVEPQSHDTRAKAGTQASETPRDSEPSGTRVRSVRVRRRETKREAPLYEPNSPQALFHEKATAKGHQIGQLERIPNSSNWTAVCETCGMDGELVVQHDENYANQTYEFPRGAVIERTCPSSQA